MRIGNKPNLNYYTDVSRITDPSSPAVLVDKFRQLDSSYIPEDLEQVALEFNPKGLMLRREARLAFEEMAGDARQKGIYLNIVSAFRSYDYQTEVYYKNITPDVPIEEYQAVRDRVSARPGHSEHQTGLAADINDLEQSFEDTPEFRWLSGNAHWYGFILRYPKGMEKITGYDYEPWHYRYLGRGLAKEVYLSRLTYDEFYNKYLKA